MIFKRSMTIILSVILLITTLFVGIIVNVNSDSAVPTVIYDFEEGQNLAYSGMQYTTEPTADGTNRYMTYSTQTGSGYPTLTFRTNYTLVKDQEYTVTFKYKFDIKVTSTGVANTYLNRKLRPVLGDSGTGYNFYACGSKNYNMETANLYTPNVNDGLNLVNTSEWKTITFNFDTTNTADKIDSTAKYLGFAMQFSPDRTVTLCIDDIKIAPAQGPITGDYLYNFENDQKLPYSGMKYRTDDTQDGSNTYLNYSATANYSSVSFKTDFVLEKNTKYLVTFKYKYDGKWLNRPIRPVLGNSTNAWDFYTCGKNYSADQANLMNPGQNTGVSLGNTNGGWKTASMTFDTTALSNDISKTVKYLGFYFQTGNNTYDLSIDDIHISYAPLPITERIEYNFEDGQEMAYQDGYKYLTEDNGNRYMSTTAKNYGMRAFRTALELSSNSKYVISFKYKFNGVNLNRPFRPVLGIDAARYNFYDCNKGYDLSSANIYDPNTNNGITLSNTSEWSSTAFVVDTSKVADKMTGNTIYYMSFGFQSTQNAEAVFSIDDLIIERIVQDDPDNYVINGGFENGKLMWNETASFAELVTDAKTGEHAIKIKDGNYSKISQMVALEENKNYKLSFWYKGTGTGVANFAICHDSASTESKYIIKSGALENADEWTEQEVVFNTGEYNAVILLLQSCAGCEYFIDDISIADTTEIPSSDSEFKSANLISEPTNSENALYIASEGNNIVTDYSFEEGNGNWKSLTNDGTLSVTDEKAHDGSKSLKFLAKDIPEDVWSYAYFNVEPDTDYFFSAWVLGENWSEVNKNEMSFGIADANSGYFITYNTLTNSTRPYTKLEQYTCSAWDGEWHLVNIKFNTGSAKLIAFAIRGNESVAYFDQIQIYKDSDKERYKAYHQTLIDAIPNMDTVDGMSDCKEGTNAVENSDLADGSSLYWQTGTNFGIYDDSEMHYYGNFIEIAETGSTKGKALHYKANTSVTGKGLQTYYMKWINVEPNTDYTFSTDFLILEKGSGAIKIVDNNPFFPNTIGSVSFGDEYYDEDKRWQKFNFKFNTGDHDKIGFFVLDGGGEAYIDNIRMFKTADAVKEAESNYPSEITSSVYAVSDGIISGIAEKTTIKEALSKIDGGNFLKVYKDGKEVSDLTQYIGTGMEVRYMDGVSIYARATVVVGGDVNGDGVVDASDISKLLKVVTKQIELSELEIYAADLDKNDYIDVTDIAKISNHIGGKKKLSVTVIE